MGGGLKKEPSEQISSSGNIIALACGPLKKQRYINPKIEMELVDFKKEIADKFAKSPLRNFTMPRVSQQTDPRDTPESGIPPAVMPQNRQRNTLRQLAQSTDANTMQNYLANLGGKSGRNKPHGALISSINPQGNGLDTMISNKAVSSANTGKPDYPQNDPMSLQMINAKNRKAPRGNSKLDPVPNQRSLHLEELALKQTEQSHVLQKLFKNNPATSRAGPSVVQSLNFKKGQLGMAQPDTSRAQANHARNRYDQAVNIYSQQVQQIRGMGQVRLDPIQLENVSASMQMGKGVSRDQADNLSPRKSQRQAPQLPNDRYDQPQTQRVVKIGQKSN